MAELSMQRKAFQIQAEILLCQVKKKMRYIRASLWLSDTHKHTHAILVETTTASQCRKRRITPFVQEDTHTHRIEEKERKKKARYFGVLA